MIVKINRSDQPIGSNWIRKANPERATVGCVLPTVGRGLPAEGCPPWAGRGLAQNVRIFIARLLRRSALVFYLNLVGPTDHIQNE